MKNRSESQLSVPIESSVTCCGFSSPSFVWCDRINWARMLAPMIWLLRMSPTRNSKHKLPSRWHTTAYLENNNVCVRCLGRVILANWMKSSSSKKIAIINIHGDLMSHGLLNYVCLPKTIPTMNACINTPYMDWKHIMNIASGHSSVVVRTPYPIVCWVSIEKRKQDVKL